MKSASYNLDELLEIVNEKAREYKPRCTEAKEVYKSVSWLLNEEQEHFVVITLNSNSEVINQHIVFKGTVNQSLVHPREVFRCAIKDNAVAIICVHNHPSGNVSPSIADNKITSRLLKAGELLGIELLDHLIVGTKGFYSYSEDNTLFKL